MNLSTLLDDAECLHRIAETAEENHAVAVRQWHFADALDRQDLAQFRGILTLGNTNLEGVIDMIDRDVGLRRL